MFANCYENNLNIGMEKLVCDDTVHNDIYTHKICSKYTNYKTHYFKHAEVAASNIVHRNPSSLAQ